MFTEVILKVASRCNLACDYCYMYEKADQSWRLQKKIMPLDTVKAAAEKLAAHNSTGNLSVFFHGGEPLLAGAEYIDKAAKILRDTIPKVKLGMQSNGVLITPEVAAMLRENHIPVGVSLDGDEVATGRHRTYLHGGNSWAAVDKALTLLAGEYRDVFGGVLCVMDTANDPVITYKSMMQYQPPSTDFLFPLGHYDDPQETGYGEWLIPIYDQWVSESADTATAIRLFTLMLDRSLGIDTRMGFLGPPPRSCSLIIEPNGEFEKIDTYKTIGEGAASTGFTAFDPYPLDTVRAHPGYQQPATPDACQPCELVDVCGGGHWANRYSEADGYNRPSIFCDDLKIIIGHVQETLKK